MQKTQTEMFYQAHRQIADRDRTFIEIQSGPNPLSKQDIQRLAAKYPERYGRYLAYAKD